MITRQETSAAADPPDKVACSPEHKHASTCGTEYSCPHGCYVLRRGARAEAGLSAQQRLVRLTCGPPASPSSRPTTSLGGRKVVVSHSETWHTQRKSCEEPSGNSGVWILDNKTAGPRAERDQEAQDPSAQHMYSDLDNHHMNHDMGLLPPSLRLYSCTKLAPKLTVTPSVGGAHAFCGLRYIVAPIFSQVAMHAPLNNQQSSRCSRASTEVVSSKAAVTTPQLSSGNDPKII